MIATATSTLEDGSASDWVREKTLLQLIPISRGRLYAGRAEGWVRFVVLRQRYNVRGVVLYHVPSILAHLSQLADKQAADRSRKAGKRKEAV